MCIYIYIYIYVTILLSYYYYHYYKMNTMIMDYISLVPSRIQKRGEGQRRHLAGRHGERRRSGVDTRLWT